MGITSFALRMIAKGKRGRQDTGDRMPVEANHKRVTARYFASPG